MTSAGSYKFQHDTSENLKFVRVFPRVCSPAAEMPTSVAPVSLVSVVTTSSSFGVVGASKLAHTGSPCGGRREELILRMMHFSGRSRLKLQGGSHRT